MSSITSLGVGSGLDLEGLVTKLMSVESQSLTTLQTKASSYNTKLSALGTLKSTLSSLQTASQGLKAKIGKTALENFASYTATTGDTTIASATASTGAVAGTYSLKVISLATAQRQVSSTALSANLNNGDTLSFSFAQNGTTRDKTITLGANNHTLAGLRDAINAAGMGVTATIITGSQGAQLTLTSEEGTDNAVTLGGSLSGYFTETVAPQNASFELNGIAATSSTNKVTSAIDGVTLNLAGTGTTSLTVTQDVATNLKSALKSFVDAYNAANTLIKTQGAYNAATKVAGPLQGNHTLRNAAATLSSTITNISMGSSATYQRPTDIGVSFSKNADGSITLDTTKLDAAISKDPLAVASLVSKIGSAFDTRLNSVVGVSGSIQVATDSLNNMLTSNSSQQSVMGERLAAIETRYRKQFSSLDTLVASLNQTSSYLTNQLKNLVSTSSSK